MGEPASAHDAGLTVAVPARIPILLYHSVRHDPAPLLADWSVTPEEFADHLGALSDAGYRALTVSELVAGLDDGVLPERTVVVTFDDGFADYEAGAVPVLAAAGVRATLYVSTAYVGGASTWLGPDGVQTMLDWDGVRRVAASGTEIGAHAHHHVALDELDGSAAADEVLRSKATLEDALGGPVASFAYPHGYHSREVQAAVRSAGFTSACGVKHACSSPRDDRFGLARVIVRPGTSGTELLVLIDAIRPAPEREALRTVAWRTVRRTRARRRGTHRPVAGGPA